MNIRKVDPRDSTFEVDQPRYRIDFWRLQGGRSGAWESESYELEDTDVAEAIAWADAHSKGRVFVLYAAFSSQEGLGIVRLLGSDPTANAAGGFSYTSENS
jgi:hypothetical protein